MLIIGEIGVGKKTLARYIHQFSSQSHHPLKIIYCGMGADQLEAYSQETKLLANDAGASGIILLDEVIEMTLHLQKHLLMLLREWEMDSSDRGKDWRLISLTRDPSRLLEMVKNSEFLADLYYRISVYLLDITPLRERVEDILPLTDYFLDIHLSDGGSVAILGNVAMPHGIYDIGLNKAYVNIGISHVTRNFSCDSIKRWWNFRGRYDYPDASFILILVDCGGSNGYRHYVFKRAIQRLADAMGIEIFIAHYPSYTSKWNPIEHRLFPHITRKIKGVILKSVEILKRLKETTTTKTGLVVRCHIIKKTYETGKKMTREEKDGLRIIHDDYLGYWNYRAVPFDL